MLDTHYIETLFATSLVNDTVVGSCDDDDVRVVFLNIHLCVVETFDENNIYYTIYSVCKNEMIKIYSRFCLQKSEDAGYLQGLFSGVYEYSMQNKNHEKLELINSDMSVEKAIIEHRTEYLF